MILYRNFVLVSWFRETRNWAIPLSSGREFDAFDTTTKTITIKTGGDVQQAGRMLWRVGGSSAEGNSATFTLKPGHYTLDFAAVRRTQFQGLWRSAVR